ncbi:MAG: TniQ family protein [Rhodocyclaceae bacterium]
MILPEPFPDEMLASLLVRLARVNGYVDYCDLVNQLFRDHQATSFIDTEINFPMFCEAVGSAYGPPQELTRNLTNLGAQMQLGELDLKERREIEDGHLTPRLGEFTFFGTTALSFCRSCVQLDIEQYGFSYWHRQHQLPVMLCCSAHGDYLSRFACQRSRLHQSFPLPGDAMVQANAVLEPTRDSQSAFWSGIAALADNIFTDRSVPFDSGIIREVFLDQLRVRGLFTARGKLRSAEFDAAFKLFFPHGLGEFDAPMLGFLGNPKQMLRGVTDFGKSPPFLRVILIYWLFGEWAAFKEQCDWSSILGEPLASPARQGFSEGVGQDRVNSDESAILLGHRQVCVDYAMEHPAPSRLEFLKNHYRSFRWLLHHDRSWLDAQLPVPPKQVVQLGLFE